MLVVDDLETTRFGVRCARLKIRKDSVPSTEEIESEAYRLGAAFVSARVDAEDMRAVHALETAGFQLMDTLVYFDHDHADLPTTSKENDLDIVLATADMADAVKDAARLAFRGYFGHYHQDPRFDPLMADSVYSDWAFRNTETVSPCRPVIVALDGEAVMGFLAAEFDKETARAEIVLNGVVPKCRSRGVYSDLLLSGLQVAKAKGCQHTEVSTQLINVAVQRVWTRFGFRPSRALYTLHRWYDSG